MAEFVRHEACPKCGSKDNLAVYSDGSAHCFGCQYTRVSEEYKQNNPMNKSRVKTMKKTVEVKQPEEFKLSKEAISTEKVDEIKSHTSLKGNNFRGISDATLKYFGVRNSVNEFGEVEERYYPCTQDGQLVGFKIREVPKTFFSVGRTGAECELFGQFRFNRGGKYVILVEGEEDQLAAYQMLKEYNDRRGSDFEVAVVSPTTGANSQKQIASQYKFFDTFENVIVAYDNDQAGKDAIEKIIKVLPKGKVKIMSLKHKDSNDYLMNKDEKAFIQDFYGAKTYTPVGVLPSEQLYDRILEQSSLAKVPFPDIMPKLNEMFAGGLPLGHIINIAADTGVGKTTLINTMIHYWVFNSPHMIGIVSMELDAGQYGEALLSFHISRKLSLIANEDEKMNLLTSDKVKLKAKELFENKEGKSRFYLLDNRDGSVEEIQDTVEELVVSCGCKIIVLDPLQDILDGLSNDEQATFMKWAKGFIKSHGVTFIFINHMRKTPAGQNGADSEQNIIGSSTIIKSASANILLKRDKMSEDPVIRNTTEIILSKNRTCGLTGSAGAVYYDNYTSKLYNLDDFLNGNT